MKPVFVFRHVAHEGPGYLDTVLSRHGIPQTLIAVDAGAPIPTALPDAAGLVFMGGPMSVNDTLPWIDAELALIRAAAAADMPMLGHCLGAQLISKALGGAITANPVKEIGWLPVQREPGGPNWLDALPADFEAFHWHGETYSLPAGATRILRSANCAEQGFVRGRTLAFQCHIEMTADMVREWARVNAAEIATPSATVQSAAGMSERLAERVATLQAQADILYTGWLRGLTH